MSDHEVDMKAIILGAILGFGSIAPSLAADLPARPYSAPSSYVPIQYDWTGFYVGANGGYGRTDGCLRVSGPLGVFVEEGCHKDGGGVAGGQVGYRWQFGGAPMVWGLEAQGDWANLRGSNVSFIDPTITNRTELQGFGLFTGQFGYALNNVLFYFKGGAAVTSDRYEDVTTASGAVLGSVSQTRWGGTAGAGVEYGFTPNWTAAFEYDRLFMGDKNVTYIGPTGIAFANKQLNRDVDLFTVRVNYRFGGPEVVRY
jgi:outer membrane immunogenic protein